MQNTIIMQSISHSLLRRLILSAAMVSVSFNIGTAQDLSTPLPKDPKVIKGQLPNGLTYYIRPNSKPEKKVELRLAVNTGSILEDDDQQGLAHFMEHMNFNGTSHFQKNDLVSYLQSIGVQFGADLNAYTSFDETVYILPIPTDKPGNLDKGFQIIEDWAHNALLTDKDIDGERGVVLEESRMGKGADDRMMQKYLPSVLVGSHYASRLPIGKDDILKNFKYDAIRRFYKDWYRPDLQAVSVVGDIDSATAMKYIMKHFAGIKNPAKERERKIFEIPSRTKPEAMVVTDKEATQYQMQVIFPTIKDPIEKTLGDYRHSIEERLVTMMINRRLSDLARSSNPPFPFAATGYDGWGRGYKAFTAFTMFGEEGPEKALTALAGELVRAKKYGFTQSELDIAKKNIMTGIEKAYNERNTTESGDYVMEYVRNFLTQEPIPGIENEYKYHKELLPGIQLNELNNLAKEMLASNNVFTLVTGPDKKETKLPSNTELLAMTEKAMAQEVKPMEEKQVASTLLATKPVPGKVTNQEKDADFDATTYTLSNGIKVTLKKTDFKSDEILLQGVKKGGLNGYGVADRNSAKYCAAVVSSMGYGSFAPTDLEKVIAGKPISVKANMGNIEDRINGNSNVKDFETMLQLMYLELTAPRKDEDLFKAFVNKNKTQVQFISANPQAAFFDTAINVLYKNNPLAPSVVPKVKDFDDIDLARSMEIYKKEFGTADGYHFFLVGNIDAATALPLIETYIGSLSGNNKTPDFKDNGVRPSSGEVIFKKGQEKQSMIFAAYNGEAPYSEDLKLKAEAVAEILNIKVVEELREKLGAIYSGGYYANVTKYPYPHYSIGMQLPCGPENVDKLLTAASLEVKNLQQNGPDAKDLDKVKNQWHEAHRTELKENNYWTETLANVMFWGYDKSTALNYDKKVDALTPADVQHTAQELFKKNNEFKSVLYPENYTTDTPRSSN